MLMAACKEDDMALDSEGHGVFSVLLIEEFNGACSDPLGNVNILDVYSYIANSLNAWQQRPLLTRRISHTCVIRQAEPAIKLSAMKKGFKLFETATSIYALDPTYYDFTKGYEPLDIYPNAAHQEIFNNLLALHNAGLVQQTTGSSLFSAAKNSQGCKLTKSGMKLWKQYKQA